MSEYPNEQQIEKPTKHRRRFSIFWPILLIAVGVVLFIQNTGAAGSANWDLLRLWPLLLIVGGLDDFWKGEGFVGGVVWIGIGVLFLLSNLNYIPGFNLVSFVVRFWPVLLVALGLDLMIGRRRVWSPLLGTGIGVLLVAGIAWLLLASPLQTSAPATVETISIPASDLTGADGSIEMAVGKLVLIKSAESAQLVSGEVHLSNGLQLSKSLPVTSSGRASYNLGTSGSSVNFGNISGDGNLWDLQLNPQVPLNLTIKTAVGEQQIDLSGMNLTDLRINMAVGKTEVTLPASGVSNGEIKGAVGELIVWLPRGTAARFNLDIGLSGLSVPADWQNPGGTFDHRKSVESPNMPASGPVITLTIGQALGNVSIRYSE